MARGKVTLDGKDYEIVEVLDSDAFDGNTRIVSLGLQPILGPADREIYKMEVSESITEFNVGSMEKGSADVVIGTNTNEGDMQLLHQVQTLEPGEALVVIRRN